jgi:hypothetical protein
VASGCFFNKPDLREEAEEKCKALNRAFDKLRALHATQAGNLEAVSATFSPGIFRFNVANVTWGVRSTATECEFRVNLKSVVDLATTDNRTQQCALLDRIPDVAAYFSRDDFERSLAANRRMAGFSEACLGRAQRIAAPYERYIGKTVLAKLTIERSSLGERNVIESYSRDQ